MIIIRIFITNPVDPKKATLLTNTDCETLEDAIETIYFFLKSCSVLKITIEGVTL